MNPAERVKFLPLVVGVVLIGLAVTTFGLPLFLGLSWWPLPITPFTPQERTPRYLAAMDNFSFPHADWPWRVLEANQLQQGHFPLWNPYSSLGLPFAAQYQNQVFLPFEWMEIFGGPTLWSLLLMSKLVLAAVGSYLVLRRLVRSDLAALAGAILYMFSAYFLWLYPVTAFVNGAVLVPWLFWGILQLKNGEAPILPACGLTSLVIGLMFLSGQPQIAFLSLAGGASYLLLMLLPSGGTKRSLLALGLFGISVCLGLGMAGTQLRIFWEALEQGYTIHPPGAYARAGTAVLNFTLPVWPFLMGQLMWPWDGTIFPGRFNPEDFPVVVSCFGLFFFCLTLVGLPTSLWQRRKQCNGGTWAMLMLFLVIIGIVVSGTAGSKAFWSLPVLNRVNFPRYISPVLSFSLAALVAWGMASLREISTQRLLAANLLVLVASLAALGLVLPYFLNAPEQVDRTYMTASLWLGVTPFLVMLVCINIALVALVQNWVSVTRAQAALLVCLTAELTFFVRYGLGLDDEMRRLWVLGAYAASSILVLMRRERLLLGIIPGLNLVTFLIVGFAPHRLAPAWDPFESPPPHIQFLKEQLGEGSKVGRVLGAQGIMVPNVATGFGIAELASLNPLQVATTARYILGALSEKPLNYTTPNAWPGIAPGSDYPFWADYFARRKYYNLVGVKYLADAPRGWLNQSKQEEIKLVYQDDRVNIYEDLDAFPRAFALNGIEVVPDVEAARKAILSPEVDFRARVIVEQGDQPLPKWLMEGVDPHFRSLEITHYSDSLVKIKVDLDHASLVVLTDSFYPGWIAYVDGQPREIYRVNSIVRGVPVEAGLHQVSFRYEPSYLYGWIVLSLGSSLISLFLVILGGRATEGTLVQYNLSPSATTTQSGVVFKALASPLQGWRGGRWGVAIVVGALISVSLGFSLRAYFGASTGDKLSVRLNEEAVRNVAGMSAFYLPVADKVSPRIPVVTASGVVSSLAAGHLVLTGSTGDLLRLRADGSVVRLVGQEGQKIWVSNVGMWDSNSKTFTGLDAIYQEGHWVIDTSTMQPANPNSLFEEGNETEPIPSFWISPRDAGYTITRMEDKGGSFVRVQATRPSSYLVINGQGPLATLDGVPASVRGQIRAHGKGQPTLTLYDVVSEDGRAESYTAQVGASEKWTTLAVQAQKVRHPAPGDNFSLGLFGVKEGDWFDVRELSVFVGILP